MKKIRLFLLNFFAQLQLSNANSGLEKALKNYDAAAASASKVKVQTELAYDAAIKKAEQIKANAQRTADATNANMDKVIRRSAYAATNITNLFVPPEER